jgi:MFS family permease
MGSWTEEFSLTNEQVGWVTGTAFWGFTLAMIFGGPLCDILGMKRIALIAFFGHAISIVLTVFAWDFWSLYVATLIFGIANGAVEAACNPLVAALYPKEKTTKLNQFHVWFPGGIVIGGLLAFALGKMGLGWRVQFGVMLLPTLVYGWKFVQLQFPKTERVQAGISTADMFKAALHPLFLLMVVCMLMTASTELGPMQWIPSILENMGANSILVLVWITGLMALGRQFAGAFVHRLSPIGMLIASSVFSALGLYLMSVFGGAMIFASATVFAIGVCFFWPTMLGYVNERFPATGALGLAIMGGAGMLSVSFVLPFIGRLKDNNIAAGLVEDQAGLSALGSVAALPLALLVVFVAIRLLDKKSKLGAAMHH